MEFLSRSEDRKPRWIIPDGSTEPKLIEEEKSGGEEQIKEGERGGEDGGGGDGGVKGKQQLCVTMLDLGSPNFHIPSNEGIMRYCKHYLRSRHVVRPMTSY